MNKGSTRWGVCVIFHLSPRTQAATLTWIPLKQRLILPNLTSSLPNDRLPLPLSFFLLFRLTLKMLTRRLSNLTAGSVH